MDLQTFLRAIRKFWWGIAVLAVLGAVGGFGYAAQATPVYASTVTFVAITHPTSESANPLAGEQYAQQRVATYADVISTDRLAGAVLAAAPGLGLTPTYLTQHIAGSARAETVLLTATIDDVDKDRSLQIATLVAKVFPEMTDAIESDNGTRQALLSFDVVDGPTLNPVPISPQTKLLIALGLVAGLILGMAIGLLREVLDNSVRSMDLLRTITDAPVLGVVFRSDPSGKGSVVMAQRARSVQAEAYRQLRTNLQFVDVDRPASIIVVTSSMPKEGKSTTAMNLALAFAESGRRVLLIDADLRRPRIGEYLGLEGAVGLTNVLAGQVVFGDVAQNWGTQGLVVLPSGSIPPNPSELLGSKQMVDLLAHLRTQYDNVVIDTPPILPVTDAAVVGRSSDGVVVVVRHGHTRRAEIRRSVGILRGVDVRVLGCVLNDAPTKGADAQLRYGEYGYHQEPVARTGRLRRLLGRLRPGSRRAAERAEFSRSAGAVTVGDVLAAELSLPDVHANGAGRHSATWASVVRESAEDERTEDAGAGVPENLTTADTPETPATPEASASAEPDASASAEPGVAAADDEPHATDRDAPVVDLAEAPDPAVEAPDSADTPDDDPASPAQAGDGDAPKDVEESQDGPAAPNGAAPSGNGGHGGAAQAPDDRAVAATAKQRALLRRQRT